MDCKIFPYSLVRYAGLHHKEFDLFNLSDTEVVINSQQNYLRKIEVLKNMLCEALFQVITRQTDNHCRQQLINLKRKIFNQKEIVPDQLLVLEKIIPSPLAADLHIYQTLLTEYHNFLLKQEALFDQEIRIHRRHMQQLALKPELQNGLMLSSPVLYTMLHDFTKKDPGRFKQKELRMEFSLLRYLSRMAFKTSPFSSFTYTGIMTMASGQINHSLNNHLVKSRLKFNNILLGYLRSVLKQHPEFKWFLLIKINITTEIKGDKIHFLTNFNNVESFQQLKANGLPMLLYNYLIAQSEPVTLNSLVDYLLHHVDADHETLKTYVFKIMDAGLFELGFGFSGMEEDWDASLLDFFKAIESKTAGVSIVINLFQTLRQIRDHYAAAVPTKRYELLQLAEQKVNEVFIQLQQEAGLPYYLTAHEKKKIDDPAMDSETFLTSSFVPYYFTARNIFYEDCYTSESSVLPAENIAAFVLKTDELAVHLLPLDLMRAERIKIRDFFNQNYLNQDKVAVTDFYRDYYFHVKKPEKECTHRHDDQPADITAWKASFLAKLKQGGYQADNLNFTASFFMDLPGCDDGAKHSSLGAFVQFYQDNHSNQFRGVINSLLPGMGKVSGRFLSLFDESISAEFIAHNEALHPGIIQAELNDASTFNANIHPPLLHYELALPSGNNIYSPEKQVKVGDLSVSLDADTGQLKLSWKDQQVYSYDLSLESFYNRSNLYQLLAHFNPDARVSLQPFIQLVDQYFLDLLGTDMPDIFMLPRITYEETVVLRRKTWRIKTAIIPIQMQQETDFNYFLRLNTWLNTQEIPAHVFLFLRKKAYQVKVAEGAKEKKEGLNDDYKPQYISFHSPLIVILFKRLLARAGTYITMEEVLPVPHQDVVKEYLIQWYKGSADGTA